MDGTSGDRPAPLHRQLGSVSRWLLLVVVVSAPVVASWHGLTAVGRDWLGLGAWSPLVPLVLDAAALYCAVLSLQSTLKGDSPGIDRALVWVYAGGAAGLNIWHADEVGGLRAALFYGAASLSAALVWERTLRSIRRDDLRGRGAIDPPTPRFRPLRWLLHTRETWGAFRIAVGAGVTDARTALALHRMRCDAERVEGEAEQAWREFDRVVREAVEVRGDLSTLPPLSLPRAIAEPTSETDLTSGDQQQQPPVLPELQGLSKAAALRHAFAELGAIDVPGARAWLKSHGIEIEKGQAYAIARKESRQSEEAGEGQDAGIQTRLAVVGGEQREEVTA